MAPAASMGISTGALFGFCGKRPRSSVRYLSARGTTTRIARTSLASSARRVSAGARLRNVTLARPRSYSSVRMLTTFRFISPPTTPTVRRFRPATSVIEDPGGATSNTTAWARMTTACACDKSPTSPRTTARSTLSDENRSAASSALVVSTRLSRTGAFVAASRLASADTSFVASPSSDPAAMVSVVGREYQT